MHTYLYKITNEFFPKSYIDCGLSFVTDSCKLLISNHVTYMAKYNTRCLTVTLKKTLKIEIGVTVPSSYGKCETVNCKSQSLHS